MSEPGSVVAPPALVRPTRRSNMKNRTCTIEGCGRFLEAHGLCLRHYYRWFKYGDPLEPDRSSPTIEFTASDLARIDRLLSHVVVTPGPLDTDCWLSTYAKGTSGYTAIGISGGRHARSHRLAYAALVGPIPKGLHLDHLCMVRHCVNPDHLEPVTAEENARRAAFSKRGGPPFFLTSH